jgi:hypothetical protein
VRVGTLQHKGARMAGAIHHGLLRPVLHGSKNASWVASCCLHSAPTRFTPFGSRFEKSFSKDPFVKKSIRKGFTYALGAFLLRPKRKVQTQNQLATVLTEFKGALRAFLLRHKQR